MVAEMAFKCPACNGGLLGIEMSMNLPPVYDDEIQLQMVKCEACGFRGIAVYRESRRGSLKSNSFFHLGYEVSDKDLEFVRSGIQRCPAPRDRRCQCETHLAWGKLYWGAPQASGMTVKREFRMELAK